jgi:hypothetical protein
MQDPGLWIGFGVGVAAATGMLAFLVWQVGRHRDLTPAQVRWAVVQVAASVALAVGAGVAGRTALGQPVLDAGKKTGSPLGLQASPMKPPDLAVVGVAMLAMLLCFLWALRTVRRVTEAPPKSEAEQD